MAPSGKAFVTRVAILAVILGAAGAAYGIEESTQPDSLQSIDTNIRSVYLDATKQAAFGSPALRLEGRKTLDPRTLPSPKDSSPSIAGGPGYGTAPGPSYYGSPPLYGPPTYASPPPPGYRPGPPPYGYYSGPPSYGHYSGPPSYGYYGPPAQSSHTESPGQDMDAVPFAIDYCKTPLQPYQMKTCCSANSCLTVDGKCGNVSTRICGMAGGTCVRAVDKVPCSAMLGNHQAVINGVCNGAGGCSITDQLQVASLCSGSVSKPCTSQPGRTLTCAQAVPLDSYTGNPAWQTKVLVAMGQSQGSCMTDSDCATGTMCYIDQFPGTCQTIAHGGTC